MQRWFISVLISSVVTCAGQSVGNGAGATPSASERAYTAEFRVTEVKTQPNGESVIEELTEVRAFDSQGRVMVSATTHPADDTQLSITQVVVTDRLNRTVTSWSIPGERITVMGLIKNLGELSESCLADRKQKHEVPSKPMPGAFKPKFENLGNEVFAGIEARGSRVTLPTLVEVGSEKQWRPRTQEVWMATDPELHLIPRAVWDDPRTGKMTEELIRFDPYEPDPSIFEPLANYEIARQPEDQFSCMMPRVVPELLGPLP
jgi:hypothetical protein